MMTFRSFPLSAAWLLSPLMLTMVGGCDARFSDLRSESTEVEVDMAMMADAAAPDTAAPDLGVPDEGAPDAGAPETGPEAGPDEGVVPEDMGVGGTVMGDLRGVSGYDATGTATLTATQLILGDGFSVDRGPGLVVVVSPRDSLGRRIDPATDTNLGVLPSFRQAPDGPPITFDFDSLQSPQNSYVHIYCEPFGVAFAIASLE